MDVLEDIVAQLACALCGAQDCDLRVNEFWAGSFHAACTHAACQDCLRSWIERELPRCRREGQLRVRCYARGCRRILPQTLVLQTSPSACGLAMEIDRVNDRLEACYRELSMEWLPSTCTVCQDYIGPTLRCRGCSVTACEGCARRWCEEQLPGCAARRALRFRCFTPACEEGVPLTVALSAPEVRGLQRRLRRRLQLQANELYPPELQVDCPRPGCVGIAYLGWDTAMCFLCEHQWSLDGSAPVDGLPGELKQCPQCQVQIEKNGGCNHMTCRCGHQFYWSTLLPYP